MQPGPHATNIAVQITDSMTAPARQLPGKLGVDDVAVPIANSTHAHSNITAPQSPRSYSNNKAEL